MNKVLVVDDEKLVRQGIITSFPWNRHGFEVAGDAGSGEKALELLGEKSIDLLVTDLAMNGMDGLELIRKAREVRADLPVVILTCHDNFRYIQEAMRLGVLDYIVKTEIEDEVVDETLTRIAAKLGSWKSSRGGSKASIASSGDGREGLLLCGPNRSSRPTELLDPGDREEWAGRFAEADTATWFARAGAETDHLLRGIEGKRRTEGWVAVRVTGIGDEDDRSLTDRLRRFRRRTLFYLRGESVREWSWERISELPPADEAEARSVREEWNAFDWVYDDEAFERLLVRTERAGQDPSELHHAFYPVVLEWERLLGNGSLKDFLDNADEWLYWSDWEAWLRAFRDGLRRTASRNATYQTAEAVFKAIELIRHSVETDIVEEDLAKAANMSRGHFSKSFKKVTGKSYGEYVRHVKLERAKEMLLRTDKPITQVAESCGFSDYRHFSRVFREHTGRLPTEFRKAGAKEV